MEAELPMLSFAALCELQLENWLQPVLMSSRAVLPTQSLGLTQSLGSWYDLQPDVPLSASRGVQGCL